MFMESNSAFFFRQRTERIGVAEDIVVAPSVSKRSPSSSLVKLSTVASKPEIVSGAAVYYNTSTPLINPDAVQAGTGQGSLCKYI